VNWILTRPRDLPSAYKADRAADSAEPVDNDGKSLWIDGGVSV